MDARFVVTPWRNSAELLQLRKDLYGSGEDCSKDRRARAVNKIFAWRLRKPDLPLLLESTADIVDVVLQDEQNQLPHNSLRLLYATAISRFVTGLSDTQIELSRDRPSWFLSGKSLEFPTSLLETRHCIVHRHLPSLFELKRAAKQALDWLWEWYWSHLDIAFTRYTQDGGVPNGIEMRERCQAILKSYVKERRSEIKSGRKEMKAVEKAISSYDFLTVLVSAKQKILIDLLVSDKAILPADKKLRSSMSGAFLIWSPLLHSLCTTTSTFFQMLLDQMIDIMNGSAVETTHVEADPIREGMYEWILHILTSAEWRVIRRKQSETIVVVGKRCEQQITHILSACFTSPNFWTLRLAGALLKDEETPNREQWLAILEAAKSDDNMEDGSVEMHLPASNEGAMDVDTVEKRLPVGVGKQSATGKIEKISGPQKVLGLWRPTPIGALPEGWEEDE